MDTSKAPQELQRQISLNSLNTALYHLREAIERAHRAGIPFRKTTEIAMIGSRIESVMKDMKEKDE